MSDTIKYLGEIRKRLIICVLAFALGTIGCFLYVDTISEFLKAPVGGITLIYVSPSEALLVNIRLAFMGGLILAMPMIIYQSVAFIYPALYKSEKRLLFPMIFFGMVLFGLGGYFAYYVVYPFAIKFFLGFAKEDLLPYFTISSFLSFISNMIFSFGLVFQLPCIFWFLGKMGVLKTKFLRKNRKYALLVILIIAAIITPPDVISQLLVGLPLLVLYEIGIWAVMISQLRKKEKK